MILSFDTSGPHCAVALLRDGAVRGDVTEPMERGQADRLLPMIKTLLAAEGATLADLGAISVGVGPGSFTGVRISVALARGLALSLRIPALGVSLFEVVAHGHMSDALLTCLPGPRGSAYVQPLRRGLPDGPAHQIDPDAAPPDLQLWPGTTVVGWEAERIGRQYEANWVAAEVTDIPGRLALIAERRLTVERETPGPPVPLYVRPPDAAQPRQAPIRRLD